MKWKIKLMPAFLLLFCSFSYGQMGQYNYKRTVESAPGQWHKIILPDDIFGKITADFSDVRIFGITKNNDTITAPYILQVAVEKIVGSDINFKLINQSKNNKGYYFTFELTEEKTINQFKLDFNRENFDWRINIEGSQDQREWFTVAKDYRILSIKNKLTHYQFTTVVFPDARYRYFRLFVSSNSKPELVTAKISAEGITAGKYRTYAINEVKTSEDKREHETIITIDLSLPVPVSYLKIYVRDTIDYYRPVTLKYLVDSVKTEKGWMYNYSTLTSATLNSIEKNELKFNGMILKKLQLVIKNQDNQPLKIDSIRVKGFEYSLLARFTEPATYYLLYGNNSASKPDYDIDRFADKIPATTTTLALGGEQSIQKENLPGTAPLFQNKMWLWSVMVMIIFILGWFSVRMMRKA
jgi:hypothetical protein